MAKTFRNDVADIPEEISSTQSLRKCFLSSVGDSCIWTGTMFSNTLSTSDGRIPIKFAGVMGLFIVHENGFDILLYNVYEYENKKDRVCKFTNFVNHNKL